MERFNTCTGTCNAPVDPTHSLTHTTPLSSGVEHLLRDVKDATIGTVSSQVSQMVTGLKGLQSRLLEIKEYMEAVLAGKLPVNHDIMYQLQVCVLMGCWDDDDVCRTIITQCVTHHAHRSPTQDVFNLLPNLNVDELAQAFAVQTNDMLQVRQILPFWRPHLWHMLVTSTTTWGIGTLHHNNPHRLCTWRR